MATTHNTAAESVYSLLNEVTELIDQIASVATGGKSFSDVGGHEYNFFAVIERLAVECANLGSMKLAIDKLTQTSDRHL